MPCNEADCCENVSDCLTVIANNLLNLETRTNQIKAYLEALNLPEDIANILIDFELRISDLEAALAAVQTLTPNSDGQQWHISGIVDAAIPRISYEA